MKYILLFVLIQGTLLLHAQSDEIKKNGDQPSRETVKDDADSLMLAFKYARKTLPKKYGFLGDCKGLAYFNKRTRHLQMKLLGQMGSIREHNKYQNYRKIK